MLRYSSSCSCSYWSISAASDRLQQQTHRPPLLLLIDGTDRRTDTRPFYDAYHILFGPRNNKVSSAHTSLLLSASRSVHPFLPSSPMWQTHRSPMLYKAFNGPDTLTIGQLDPRLIYGISWVHMSLPCPTSNKQTNGVLTVSLATCCSGK